jgi:hypothetical protein
LNKILHSSTFNKLPIKIPDHYRGCVVREKVIGERSNMNLRIIKDTQPKLELLGRRGKEVVVDELEW